MGAFTWTGTSFCRLLPRVWPRLGISHSRISKTLVEKRFVSPFPCQLVYVLNYVVYVYVFGDVCVRMRNCLHTYDVYVCVCVYIYIYIMYICIHMHIHVHVNKHDMVGHSWDVCLAKFIRARRCVRDLTLLEAAINCT